MKHLRKFNEGFFKKDKKKAIDILKYKDEIEDYLYNIEDFSHASSNIDRDYTGITIWGDKIDSEDKKTNGYNYISYSYQINEGEELVTKSLINDINIELNEIKDRVEELDKDINIEFYHTYWLNKYLKIYIIIYSGEPGDFQRIVGDHHENVWGTKGMPKYFKFKGYKL